jgi:hypothetical protein
MTYAEAMGAIPGGSDFEAPQRGRDGNDSTQGSNSGSH